MDQKLISHFEKIYIHEASRGSKVALRALDFFPTEKIEFVSEDPLQNLKGALSAAEFNRSKRLLYIKQFRGQFFKRCPGASQKKLVTCCNYHVLNLGQQCNMNCSYCYLQSYLNTPYSIIYSNIDQALQELKEMSELHADQPFRIGTGEVIDSLSLDELTLYSSDLIEFFKQYPKWHLEFKTKSNKVDQFLNKDHAGNVIVSWSINAQKITETEEHGTASLEERLQAAEKCLKKGFKIAFHIDPMIWFEGWPSAYLDLVEQINSRFKPEDLHVISLGALRFQPEQRHMMRERFGMKSLVTSAEMLTSDSGKMRYDQKLRQEMFQFVIQNFRNLNPAWKIFLCMETPESWISSFEALPMKVDGLREIFKPLPKI